MDYEGSLMAIFWLLSIYNTATPMANTPIEFTILNITI